MKGLRMQMLLLVLLLLLLLLVVGLAVRVGIVGMILAVLAGVAACAGVASADGSGRQYATMRVALQSELLLLAVLSDGIDAGIPAAEVEARSVEERAASAHDKPSCGRRG